MTEEEFALLSAGAALGALNDDDQRAYDRALAEHPEWAGLAEEDAATAASLADLAGDVPPPAALRERILAGIDVPSVDPGDPREAGRRPWGTRGWFALAASLILIAGIGIGAVIATQQARPAAVVALDRIEAAPDARQASAQVEGGGSATLHWSESLDEAVLVTGELPDVSTDETFEVWYVRGETAASAGTFDPSGESTSALLEPGLQSGDVIAVTVEQSGGSPTGQPTSDPILAIATS